MRSRFGPGRASGGLFGTLIGVGFGVGEALAGWLAPAPGQPVVLVDLGLSLAALGLVGAVLGAAWRGLPCLVIGLVAGPHAARTAGVPEPVGWAAGLGLGAIGLGPWALPVLPVAGALTSLARPRAGGLELDRPAGVGVDVVLVTVDTLRADHGELPGMDVHRAVVSAAPWTLPAMHSVMLGQPVRAHGGGLPVAGGYTVPDPSLPTLAERFAVLGYRTAAVVSNPHLRAELDFDRGFDRFVHADDFVEPLLAVHTWQRWRSRLTGEVERLRHRRDELVLREANELLAADGDGPLFLWVHLLGPHEYARDPLAPVPGWAPGVADEVVLVGAYGTNVEVTLGRLARWLDEVPEDARVAVTADHGETLAPDFRHGTSLDDDQLLVPLWTRGVEVRGRQLASMDLGQALVSGAVLDGRDVVEVGGVRRDGEAFAARAPEGVYVERQAPTTVGTARELGEHVLEELQAIGYVD